MPCLWFLLRSKSSMQRSTYKGCAFAFAFDQLAFLYFKVQILLAIAIARHRMRINFAYTQSQTLHYGLARGADERGDSKLTHYDPLLHRLH